MSELLLTNAVIIDVLTEESKENKAIHIKDQRINWIGDTSQAKGKFEELKVIDLKGDTVLPGLINVHVHLCYSGEVKRTINNLSEPIETIKVIKNAERNLQSGITTVRDCGCTTSAAVEVTKAIESNLMTGPRIIPSGRALKMTGGHGVNIGREVDGVDEIRKAAREEIKKGAKALKVIATGGVLSPGTEIGSSELNYEEIAAVVEEANKKGIIVAAHAIGTNGILTAIRAGVHSIEHGSYINDEAIKLMKEKGVFHIPTLTAYASIIQNKSDTNLDKTFIHKAEEAHKINLDSFKKSRSAGVNFAVGTDAGTPFNPHGSIFKELQLMLDSGVSNIEALQSASIEAAKLLKLDNEIGSISEGKIADIITVKGNPTKDITTIKNVKLVMKEGKVLFQD